MTRTGLCLAAALLAGARAPRAARADGIRVVDLTPSFPAGPYLGLTVDPRDPDRIAVATADGRVGWGEEAGARCDESRVVAPREYLSAPLRARPRLLSLAPGPLPARSTLSGLHGEPPGTRLFLWLLKEERPVARWQYWMSVENPRLEIYDVTIPSPGHPALAAGAAGLFRGDCRADGWIQVAGTPAPRGATLSAYAVTVDPERPAEAFAGTSAGLLVSHDGGRTFAPHRDPELAGVEIPPLRLGSARARPPAGPGAAGRLPVARRRRHLRPLLRRRGGRQHGGGRTRRRLRRHPPRPDRAGARPPAVPRRGGGRRRPAGRRRLADRHRKRAGVAHRRRREPGAASRAGGRTLPAPRRERRRRLAADQPRDPPRHRRPRRRGERPPPPRGCCCRRRRSTGPRWRASGSPAPSTPAWASPGTRTCCRA